MMEKRRAIIITAAILLACLGAAVSFSQELVDRVVAVVGDEVILMSELQQKIAQEMMARNMDSSTNPQQLQKLQEDILQGEIDNRLLVEKAQRDSLQIDMQEVDHELRQRIADFKSQVGSDSLYYRELESYGISELELRNMWREMITKDMLRQQLLMQMTGYISVTPQEVEQWFEANADSLGTQPAQYKTSHILIYPRVTENRLQEARRELTELRERALAGEDFEQLAREYSDAPTAAEDGGYLDYFNRNSGYFPEFVQTAFALDEGEISDIVQTPLGLHIIKVEDIRGDDISARHILKQVQFGETDAKEITARLNEIRRKVLEGEATFDEMAREYSEDESSAPLGGELNWLSENEIIPSFRTILGNLEKGEISEPFQSEFGYHIIRLDDFRPAHTLNIRDDRNVVEQQIRQQKTIEEYNRIISDLRQETYIDIRLN